MNDMQLAVQEMHKVFGHPVAEKPTLVDWETHRLRYELIAEELEEYGEACLNGDLVEIADAIADLLVVVFGTAAVHGIDAQRVFDIVMASNASKLGEDGKAIISRGMELDGKPLGKFLKGPNYFEPQPEIAKELERQATTWN